MRRSGGLAALATATWMFLAGSPASVQAEAFTDGAARFEVITPSLIRLQYAADGRFEPAHHHHRGRLDRRPRASQDDRATASA